MSGTSDLAPLDQQAEIIHTMFPDAKKVGLLYCTAEPNSVYQLDVITPYIESYGYEVQRFGFADSNDIASVVTSACDYADVLYVPTDNTAANNTEVISNICVPAKVPVIAGEEGICKGCGVATLSISYYDIGYKAGEMAYDILVNGADITTMAIEYAPNVTKEYNAEMCEELGITPPERLRGDRDRGLILSIPLKMPHSPSGAVACCAARLFCVWRRNTGGLLSEHNGAFQRPARRVRAGAYLGHNGDWRIHYL